MVNNADLVCNYCICDYDYDYDLKVVKIAQCMYCYNLSHDVWDITSNFN